MVRHVIEALVLVVGSVGWMISIPQFRLLLKNKDSTSNSLFGPTGNIVTQSILLTNAILYVNWQVCLSFGAGLTTSVLMASCVLYYRFYPGGRGASVPPDDTKKLGALHIGSPRPRRLKATLSRHAARLPMRSTRHGRPRMYTRQPV